MLDNFALQFSYVRTPPQTIDINTHLIQTIICRSDTISMLFLFSVKNAMLSEIKMKSLRTSIKKYVEKKL